MQMILAEETHMTSFFLGKRLRTPQGLSVHLMVFWVRLDLLDRLDRLDRLDLRERTV
jgi:hypothetical protein